MRDNNVRNIWKAGGAVVNGWLAIPSSISAEAMAHAGWDSLTIDIQHGLVDYAGAVPMFQAISSTGVTPMVRVPWNEPGIIMKCLDSGSAGIICPMISSREEAAALVGACKYPPLGTRSYAGARNFIYHGPRYTVQGANDTVLAIAMIETEGALANLDEIMTTPGLDGIYVGPADLALALGRPVSGNPTDEVVLKEISRILDTARRHNMPAGIHTGGPEFAVKMIKLGYQLVSITSDVALLTLAAQQAITAVREGTGAAAPASGGTKASY